MTNALPIVHVVDDDASFRTAIGDLLRACGYSVALYESATQLLKMLPGDEPGCILLDVQMAGLSGLQLQDRLAQLDHRLPIVFVTGHGDIPTSVQAIKAGAEDFLTKPVAKEKLLEAIERALAALRGNARAGLSDRRAALAFLPAYVSRTAGLRAAGSRQASQADRLCPGYHGTNRKNASAQCDAEMPGTIARRACDFCRTAGIAGRTGYRGKPASGTGRDDIDTSDVFRPFS